MKTQVNSGKLPARKNVGKIMQNVGSRRLTPKSAKMVCYPILQIQSNKQGKRFEESKNRFNRHGGQAGSCTSEQNISTVWTLGQFDIGQLENRTSLVQYFGSLKFSDK